MIKFMNWDKIYWKMISVTVGSFGLSQFAHFVHNGKDFDGNRLTMIALIISIPALIALTVIICVTLAYMYDRKYINKDLAVEKANEKQSEDLKKWIDKRINGKLEKIMEVINKNNKGEKK